MTVKRCVNCDHPYYRHAPDDLELCRTKSCPCPGFLTPTRGKPSPFDLATEMVRFAHHHHAFGDEHCTPANCSVSEWLALHPATKAGSS